MRESKHIETPYIAFKINDNTISPQLCNKYAQIAIIETGNHEENVATINFIVQACNNHDALVDALKKIIASVVFPACETCNSQYSLDGETVEALKQALADATK